MIREYFLNQALEVDPREAKLPAWARGKLTTMRRAATESVAELAALKAGTEPGPFYIEEWESKRRFFMPCLTGQLLCAPVSPEDRTLGLNCNNPQYENGWLIVTAHGGDLLTKPHSSNVMLLRVE